MECIVCYKLTKIKTECNHILCNECNEKLKKRECPYCRQELEKPFEIIISFYHFIYLFDLFYKDNKEYIKLKEKNYLSSIITLELIFYIEEIDKFDDKGIKLKIYEHSFSKNFSRGKIVFSVPNLDNDKKEYNYFTLKKKGLILENYINNKY